MQFLVNILPLVSGSVDLHIFSDPDPGSQNLADPKHWILNLKVPAVDIKIKCPTQKFPGQILIKMCNVSLGLKSSFDSSVNIFSALGGCTSMFYSTQGSVQPQKTRREVIIRVLL